MRIAPVRIPEPVYQHPIELRLHRDLKDRGSEFVERYLTENQNNSIPFISRDAVKLLFPEFRQDPAKNNRYTDGAASAIADAARRTLLLRAVRSERNQVIINTGCPASGKTGAAGPRLVDKVDFEHETILTALPKAIDLLEQTLAAARFPLLRLFYTDDPRINVRRMIKRARRIGRTVPLRYMAETYVGVPSIVSQLENIFGRQISVQVTNNSDAPGESVSHNRIDRALYHVGRYNEQSALEAMYAELNAIRSGPDPLSETILEEATR